MKQKDLKIINRGYSIPDWVWKEYYAENDDLDPLGFYIGSLIFHRLSESELDSCVAQLIAEYLGWC